jgi:hypothetical protein
MSLLRDVVEKLLPADFARDGRLAAPMSGSAELYFTAEGETKKDGDLELLRSLCR